MKEYIEREAVREYFHLGVDCNDCEQDARRCQYFDEITRMDICSAIDDIPADDVVEVRHGEWVLSVYTVDIPDIHRWHEWHCSNCGYVRKAGWEHTEDGRKPKAKYCENCCSKMDGGANDV